MPLYNEKAGVEIVRQVYAPVAMLQLRVPRKDPKVRNVIEEFGWQAGSLREMLQDTNKKFSGSDVALMEEALDSLNHFESGSHTAVFDTSKEIKFRSDKNGPVALLPLRKARLHNEIITVMRLSAPELEVILNGPNAYSESDRAYMKKARLIFNDPAALKAALDKAAHSPQPEFAP